MELSFIDRFLCGAETALRTLSGGVRALRPSPAAGLESAGAAPLSPRARRHAAGLIRVDHVGEVCAQALYQAQALASRHPETRERLAQAAREEIDHLAWTEQRLAELGARTSVLNPLWYAGSFAIGLVAGRLGDAVNLGFVVETERQVEQHLAGHLDELPAEDAASRAIVARMQADEVEHAAWARREGGVPLPAPVRAAMRAAAKVMTTTAYYI
jgi:ubiquinone biosynthesis monooxygenase Coq7